MPFNIRMGVPEMEAIWNDLSSRQQQKKLQKHEEKFFKEVGQSHRISQTEPAAPESGLT
jgi:hypothetical protein